MTVLLEEAFEKASKLPEKMQDVIAGEILADIEEDRLAKLTGKALRERQSKVTGKKRELKVMIPEDEELFVKDDLGLFLAKKDFMKKLIEIDMAEKLSAESKLTGDDVEALSELVKEGLYNKVKSS